jgi:hypothetical protein
VTIIWYIVIQEKVISGGYDCVSDNKLNHLAENFRTITGNTVQGCCREGEKYG